MAHDRYDLIIVGAGPAGLASGIEAQRAGLKYLVVDKGGVAHSIQQFQRSMYFFSTPDLLEVGDIPFVVPTIRPTSLDCVNYYRSVVSRYKLRCLFHTPVTTVRPMKGGFAVECKGRRALQTSGVVIATGYYDNPNWLDVPGEEQSHIQHYYRDPLPFFEQNVVVVGGKNSAVEAALDLFRHGARVTLVHRGTQLSDGVKYWIRPDFDNRIADGSIRALFSAQVREFLKDEVIVTAGHSRTETISCHFAFVLIGYRPDTSLLKSAGAAVDPETNAPVYDSTTMQTNVPGLFVAGGLAGGRFTNKVFVENGREHGKKIVKYFADLNR